MFNVRVFLTNACLAGLDLTLTVLCVLGFYALTSGGPATANVLGREPVAAVILVAPTCLILATWFGMYRSRRIDSPLADLGVLARVDLALWVTARLASGLRPEWIVVTDLVTFPFLATHFSVLIIVRSSVRIALRHLRRNGFDVKRVVLVGSRSLGDKIESRINERAHYGYRIVRRFTLTEQPDDTTEEFAHQITRYLESARVDDVILALPSQAQQLSLDLVGRCEALGINVRIVPDLFPLIRTDTQIYDFEGIPMVNARLYPNEYLSYAVFKRCFDILFSTLVLILCAPLFLVLAVLVKATSPGPIFFTQQRVGMQGRLFRIIKFRTMRHGHCFDPDSHWTLANDSNVTPVGRWMRRTNLDEIPQFLNVLKGDMSVVGPRPERPFFLERFRREVPDYMARHCVRSGITGWAQVHGLRGDTSIPQRVAHDLYYIRNWAVALDLKIVALTIARTLSSEVFVDGRRKPGSIGP